MCACSIPRCCCCDPPATHQCTLRTWQHPRDCHTLTHHCVETTQGRSFHTAADPDLPQHHAGTAAGPTLLAAGACGSDQSHCCCCRHPPARVSQDGLQGAPDRAGARLQGPKRPVWRCEAGAWRAAWERIRSHGQRARKPAASLAVPMHVLGQIAKRARPPSRVPQALQRRVQRALVPTPPPHPPLAHHGTCCSRWCCGGGRAATCLWGQEEPACRVPGDHTVPLCANL
jgi:hypothetical protein